MKQTIILFISIVFLILFAVPPVVFAEDLPAGRVIPKISKTANDPVLSNGHVYPFWGPVCQRYTYSVVYSDKEGRSPEYVKIYFNGEMVDMNPSFNKSSASKEDYQKGVKYEYKFVPAKIGSNFYYFEASNGLGKTRASIIESPDNGPVLFDADFKNNEVVLADAQTGQEVWRYSTGEEWVGAVVLSDDGKYLAVQTSNHIYFFETEKNSPIWSYESQAKASIGGDVKGGVAISAVGDKIFAAINGKALMFDKNSNKPVWTYNLDDNGGGAYGVDIAKNGQYAAVAMAGEESNQNSNVLLMFNAQGKKLWQYHASGNWHEVSLSADGAYVAGATGCPDRRGYLFGKDSDKPIFKSEPLSKESPIDEARISANGELVTFGVESGYGAVVLIDKSGKQIWKYDTGQAKSVRALAITPNGNTIGAGTFGGDILLFNKDSNKPFKQLNINSAIGAFDISDDATVFATGSADKKLRIFNNQSGNPNAEIILNEYVGELDISANGKYIAAGTSGSVYFFESLIDLNDIKTSVCGEVIEPAKEADSAFDEQNNDSSLINLKTKVTLFWPSAVFAGVAGLFTVALIAYLIVCWRKKINSKKIYIIISSLIIVISSGLAYYYWQIYENSNTSKIQNSASGNEQNADAETGDSEISEPGDVQNSNQSASDQNVIETEDGQSSINTNANNTNSAANNSISGSVVCGNDICEPDAGENKDNCKDCTNNN